MKEWIYGRNPVYEVLNAGRRHPFVLHVKKGTKVKDRLGDILQLSKEKNLPILWVLQQDLDVINKNHQGVALQVSGYPYANLQQILDLADERMEPPFILILDTLQDPQNLATLIRTAEIVSVHGVLLPLRRTVTITPAVVNASSGATEHLLISQVNLAQAIERLKKENIWIVGLEGSPEAQPPEQINLNGAIGLTVGSEGSGMRKLVRNSCDVLLRLPMKGKVESLNAAIAGSIGLYLAWGARGYQ